MADIISQKSEALCSTFRPGCGAILKGSKMMTLTDIQVTRMLLILN